MSEEKTKTEFDSTMEALRRAESVLPDFTSSYDSQIRRLYDEIVNRPAFRYDPAGDPLYRSYRTQMVTEGQRAMRDTMGQAASLTGGYGSSYAQSVGQHEYEYYLQRLGQVMPQLYQAAWERYNAEGDALKGLFDSTMALAQDEVGRAKDRYDMAAKLEEQAYQRGQDELGAAPVPAAAGGLFPDAGAGEAQLRARGEELSEHDEAHHPERLHAERRGALCRRDEPRSGRCAAQQLSHEKPHGNGHVRRTRRQ